MNKQVFEFNLRTGVFFIGHNEEKDIHYFSRTKGFKYIKNYNSVNPFIMKRTTEIVFVNQNKYRNWEMGTFYSYYDIKALNPLRLTLSCLPSNGNISFRYQND